MSSNGANVERRNPFVGPRPLRVREKIYGRDREIDELFELLTAERIVWLHSPSGAGKTSLIQAGLIPLLEEDGFHVCRTIRVGSELTEAESVAATPLNRYVLSTIRSLEEELVGAERRPDEELRRLTLEEYLKGRPDPPSASSSAVLFFDQFEEILTVEPLAAEAEAQRTNFFRQLSAVLQNRYVWALFALREEYFSALHHYASYLPSGLSNAFRLDLLRAPEAREAITKTAKRQGGREFEDAAAVRLVTDLSNVSEKKGDLVETMPGQYVEPVQLQVVCHNLWEKLEPGDSPVTVAHVEQAGVDLVDKALSDYYRRQVESASSKSGVAERAIRDWVERKLVTADGIRTQVIQGRQESGGLHNGAIHLLEDAHLVRSEKRAGAIWFELAHDRLVDPVRSSNQEWFTKHLSLLQRQADNWMREGRPDGLLLRDEALEDAERWSVAHADELKDVERDLLQKSRAAQRAVLERRRKNRQIRVLAAAATLIAVLAFAFFLRARAAEGEATEQAQLATAAEARALEEAKNARQAEADAKVQAQRARTAERTAVAEANKARAAEADANDQAKRARIAEARAVEEAKNARQAETEAKAQAQRARAAEETARKAAADAKDNLEALVDALEADLSSNEPATVLYALEKLLGNGASDRVKQLIGHDDFAEWFRIPGNQQQAVSERNIVSLTLALDRANLQRRSPHWHELRVYLAQRFANRRGIVESAPDVAKVRFDGGGTFWMGSADDENDRDPDERPKREIQISSFAIQEHEVTSGEYWRFDPSREPSDDETRNAIRDLPVVNVTWYEAMAYAAWLSGSLPTEAQWEFAAAQFADSDNDMGTDERTAPPASPDGVPDYMVGNVWEWCRDVYAPYPSSQEEAQLVDNPLGPVTGPQRVLRGGSFYNRKQGDARYLTGTSRNFLVPDDQQEIVGFRVAWTDALDTTTSVAREIQWPPRR